MSISRAVAARRAVSENGRTRKWLHCWAGAKQRIGQVGSATGSCLCDYVQHYSVNKGNHYTIVMQAFSFGSSVARYSSGIDNQGDFS
ncbi:hypothetical protein [Mesorhizobium sp.]|uniref:hypothetical protein n=1 Tax=Mesorhizobium sp. TaxID=1871066 RepID=UPI000FE5B664|nr:hypothetical protein [Mesorhizobium sp.]RWP12493.1 MAG: hypothetical protein EOQ97_06430 [Mesorhizobium sp.]